jgi:fructokinase
MFNNTAEYDLRCVCVGEVLWDILPNGRRLGGAPANVAAYLTQFGIATELVSAVGIDDEGQEILERLASNGIGTHGVSTVADLPTGTASVVLDADGAPSFSIATPSAWDAIPLRDRATGLDANAIIFGLLAQRSTRSREAICNLVAQAPYSCLRVLDVNLRPPYFNESLVRSSLEMADVVKLNDLELPLLAQMIGLEGDETSKLKELQRRYDLQLVAYTKGASGSRMITAECDEAHSGYSVKVMDTVGAGDAFTATVVAGWLRGMDINDLQDCANRVASFVCSQAGAVTKLRADVVTEIRNGKVLN